MCWCCTAGKNACPTTKLPLRELHAAAGATQTVFIPFLHARITGQEAAAAERREGFAVKGDQGAGDTHLARRCLAVGATARAGDDDIDLVALACNVEGVEHGLL